MATMVSKRYDAATAKIAPDKQHSLEEAIGVLKAMPAAKFDESVDLSFRLGVDPKHADQMVRGAVVLPHGIGKTVRVAVFAKGEKEREAREAGARRGWQPWVRRGPVRRIAIAPTARYTTSMPMLRAVPSTIRIAASIEAVLRSTSLVWAISRTCCLVTLPILSLCGIAEALAMPAARLSSTAAGGVFTTKVKERSW